MATVAKQQPITTHKMNGDRTFCGKTQDDTLRADAPMSDEPTCKQCQVGEDQAKRRLALVPASKPQIATATYLDGDGVEVELSTDVPNYPSMTEKQFSEYMVAAAGSVREHNTHTGLAIAVKIIPGVEEAKHRLKRGEALVGMGGKTFKGEKQIGAYVRNLGLNPDTVRQWKHRLEEATLIKKLRAMGIDPAKKRQTTTNKEEQPALPPAQSALPPAQEPTRDTVMPEIQPGEWRQATFPADHYDEKRRSKIKPGEWENTDGRRIQKMQIVKPGQEKKPFKDRERIDIYKVSDQYGNIENAPTLDEAKKVVRPISTREEMLEKADLIAKIVKDYGEESYDPVVIEQVDEYLAMRRIAVDTEPEQEEGSRRKPQYHVTLTIEGSTKDAVLDTAKSAFGSKLKTVELVQYGFSRAADLERAENLETEAAEIVGELKRGLEEWKEGMPEQFQGGYKEEELDSAISALEEIENALDGIGWDVEFPGMF
jgi:hypothetical protein